MAPRSSAHLAVVPPPRQRPLDNAVFGMMLFVGAEIMMFGGLISAHTIARSSALEWPPLGQPRLPVEATFFNTLVLMASGVTLFFTGRIMARDRAAASRPFLAAIGLGAFFVLFQGYEWTRLLAQGLTVATSTHSGFFYVLVGAHAVHAVGALIGLAWAWRLLQRRSLPLGTFHGVALFWYFVVLLWPILYLRVYL